MTAEREARAPQIVTRPVAPAASGWSLSLPEASSSNHGVARPPLRGSTPSDELGVDEPLPAVVELHRIDHVAFRVVHPGRDEDVVVAVGIEVADARSPRAVVLDVDGVGDLVEPAGTVLLEERVAPDARLAVAAEFDRPLHRRLHLARGVGADHVAHVGVHVGDEDVQAAVVVEVEDLDAHRAPRRPREDLAALLDEARAADVLVVLIVAQHVQHVQIGPAVVVHVDHARVARPREILQAGALRHVHEAVAALVVIEDAPFGALRASGGPKTRPRRRRSTVAVARRRCRSCTGRR